MNPSMLPGTQGLGLSPPRMSGSPLSHSQVKQKHPRPVCRGFWKGQQGSTGGKDLPAGSHPPQAGNKAVFHSRCVWTPSILSCWGSPAASLPPCAVCGCAVLGCACGVGVSRYQNNMQTAAQSTTEIAHGAAALLCEGFASSGTCCLAMGMHRCPAEVWPGLGEGPGLFGEQCCLQVSALCVGRGGSWLVSSTHGGRRVAIQVEGSQLVPAFPSCQLYLVDFTHQ